MRNEPVMKHSGDRYEADGRTAWCWRNGIRTQKRMFMTEGECFSWVSGMNEKEADL